MRILYHHRTLADGAEGIHIAEMVKAFRGLGHDVRVKGVLASGGLGTTGQAGPGLRRFMPEAMVEVAALGYNLPDFVATERAIREFRPDVIYKRHGRYDIAPLLAARRHRVPTILEVNAVYSAKPYRDFEPLVLRPVAERLERAVFRMAASIFAVSSPLARQVESLGGRPAVVMPNGADPVRFDPRAAAPARVRQQLGLGDAIVVGWSGILRRWHGLDFLLTTIAAMPSVTLLVIGDGPERGALERRAAELGVRDRVVITGRVPHGEMRDYLAVMDIGVVSDERTGVASPMKLLEYMAMGRAVVAPRLGGIVDLVDDGDNGLLFAAGDGGSLQAALARLMNDAALRSRLGGAARKKVEDRLNWRHNAQAALETVSRGVSTRPVNSVLTSIEDLHS